MDAHTPYRPEPAHREWSSSDERNLAAGLDDYVWAYLDRRRPLSELHSLVNIYDECIRQVDDEIGRVLTILKERNDLRDTLVVVTADHGECFGEEELGQLAIGHGATAGPVDPLLRVPLIVKLPGQEDSRTVTDPASLSQFPSAVRAVLADETTSDIFVPNGPVLASMLGLSPAEQQAKPSEFDALPDYDREARVTYDREDDGRVLKRVQYDDETFRVDVSNPQNSRRLDANDRTKNVIQKYFKGISLTGNVQYKQTREVSTKAEHRLEELGYR
jgi:arylsulfatase